ncbi:MAG: chitobiase/beta-hexosaminidase C-terminal domain-containing protein [Fibrobacteres bacterium]|nr:chitobiase/beta-hexosaminidase C-terminal domain-containing protein [Fibrobacterota bacterium]
MVPPGDSGWVGSTSFSFNTDGGLLTPFNGKIMYTLDGSAPQKNETGSTIRYYPGDRITLESTTTVRAIHVSGTSVSSEISADFVRAKVPKPVARYNGNTHFYPTLACSLSVATIKNPTTLRYTLDGSAPGPASPIYAGTAIPLSKSTIVEAYATATGYDDSDPLKVDFVLDQAATPVIDPAPGSFKTTSLTVHIKSATAGAHIRYTIDPTANAPEKWTLMTGDSLTFAAGHDGDSIQLRAQAFVSTYQVSAIQSAKFTYLPAVAAPVFNPAAKTFYDTLWVRMTSATAGATVRYTDDGTTPTATSLDGSAALLIQKSDTLKAKAFKDKHDPSAMSAAAYIMQLSQPTSDKPDGEYTGSLTIHLRKVNPSASIYYFLDGNIPGLLPNGTVNGIRADSTGAITLSADGATVVNAIAVASGVSSTVAQFTYTRQPTITTYSTPDIDPVSREFIDTLSIRMITTDANVEIHYTLSANGRDPTVNDPVAVSGQSILLDSSAVLRCYATARAGTPSPLKASGINEMRYTLRPSVPTVFPVPGADPVAPGTMVTLKSRTKGGLIHYSLDPNADLSKTAGYPDSVSISLTTSATINAETMLGSGSNLVASGVLTVHYDVYASAPSDTLAVNGIRPISGGFAYQNQSPQPVIAKVRTADGMGLTGFTDISLVVSLQAMDPGQLLKVIFTKPAGTKVSLYRYAGGVVEFVPGKDSNILTLPGDYFTAVDVQPPLISIERQIPRDGDSTTVRIKITDNVSNPTCEITSPGLKGGSVSRKLDTAGVANVNVKGDAKNPASLWLRVVSRDAYDSSRMPPEPTGKIYVAQQWSQVATPNVLMIGQGKDQELWDLAGLPVGPGAGISWAQLHADNPDMQACVWRNGGYDSLNDSDRIAQGMAFWIGSRSQHSNLNLSQLQAGESDAKGTYRIRVKPGWNQITSPYLDTVYWPITPAVSQGGSTFLKAPYRYARKTQGTWTQTDTLMPWIGYFVFYYGSLDTLVTVYSSAAARPAAKAAAWMGDAFGKPSAGALPAASLSLELSADAIPTLRLGARSWAQNDIGPEDEPRPPAWGRSSAAWALRGTGSLLTDLVRLQPGSVSRWQVVIDPGEKGIGNLRVKEADLPAGYEAWAVSRARGLKFRLNPGTAIPASSGFTDTLSVFAGTAEALAGIGELARAPESVDALAFALERNHSQAVLRIDLPWIGRVEADVYTLSGRRLAGLNAGPLGPGIYRLPLLIGSHPETLFLRLRIAGPNGSQAFSRILAP